MASDEAGNHREKGGVDPSAVDPHVAAERSVDDERLLDGENPQSKHPDDAIHWITAYSELVEYKERLLAASARDRATMETDAAVRETSEIDVPVLRHELERYRRRLRFWETRWEELSAGGA